MSTLEFTSPSTGEVCSAAQLIAEVMVRREADKKRVNLPHKFWNTPEWQKKYKQQIIAANGLLKIYSPLAILNGLKRKECSWQYSLRVQGMNDIFKEEQVKIDKVLENCEVLRTFSQDTSTEIKKFGKKTILNKLKD